MRSGKSRREEVIQLGAKDSLVFAMALFNPPKPSAKLQDAFRRHDELLRGHKVTSR